VLVPIRGDDDDDDDVNDVNTPTAATIETALGYSTRNPPHNSVPSIYPWLLSPAPRERAIGDGTGFKKIWARAWCVRSDGVRRL
jgi:hypothetical protein